MTPSAAPATQVHITIDTECTEERVVRGRAWPALGYGPTIWGDLDLGRDFGLPFLVGALRRHGMTGTFFLEPLCARLFGEDGLAEVVGWLLSHGQDVQLHLHPLFRQDGWIEAGRRAPPDNIGSFPLAEQRSLLLEGIEILARCGLPRDVLVAFRAGNYGADNGTLEVLAELGFRLDSSLNPSYLGRSCRIELPGAPNDLFALDSGLLELPISNVESPRGALRHLQVTAMSLAEIRAAIRGLRDAGAAHVTIVTHPREFFYIDRSSPLRGRPNWINIRRFLGLLEWLAAHPDQFQVRDVGSLARSLSAPTVVPGATPSHLPALRPWYRLGRLLAQGIKRMDSRVGVLGPFDSGRDVPFVPRRPNGAGPR